MGNKITFRVYDANGNDVTDANFWYVDAIGDLYAEVVEGGEEYLKMMPDYTYKAVIE